MLLSRKLKENLERTIEQRREEGARALYEWFERRGHGTQGGQALRRATAVPPRRAAEGAQMTASEEQRKPGRPVKRKPPEPIPDTAEGVVAALLKTRPKAERDALRQRGEEPSR